MSTWSARPLDFAICLSFASSPHRHGRLAPERGKNASQRLERPPVSQSKWGAERPSMAVLENFRVSALVVRLFSPEGSQSAGRQERRATPGAARAETPARARPRSICRKKEKGASRASSPSHASIPPAASALATVSNSEAAATRRAPRIPKKDLQQSSAAPRQGPRRRYCRS